MAGEEVQSIQVELRIAKDKFVRIVMVSSGYDSINSCVQASWCDIYRISEISRKVFFLEERVILY